MIVNKFGTHILNDQELYYFCILPMILRHTTDQFTLSNGQRRRCYKINGGGTTLPFPLPDAEVRSVHCSNEIDIVINNNAFTTTNLIGHRLTSGDSISIVRSAKVSVSLGDLYVGLILKCKLTKDDE